MTVLDILCLANSYKLGGRCIAGLRIDGEGWIRPQARTPHGELHPAHYLLQDGSFPRMLDLIRIPFERREPSPHQPENWLIADGAWKLIHRGLPPDLAPLLRANLAGTPLLLGDRSRRIPFDRFAGMPARSSLALVSPPDLAWSIDRTPYNARKPSALFSLAGAKYKLPVTDPLWLDAFRELPPGTHPLAACGVDPASQVLLTVSLGEPFDDGHCYKLVSAIIPVAPELLLGNEAPLARSEAAWILDALASGMDPYTGGRMPLTGPLASPDTLRALRAASAALRAPTQMPDRMPVQSEAPRQDFAARRSPKASLP